MKRLIPFAALLLLSCASPSAQPAYDLVVRGGTIYELGGPEVRTFKEIMEYVLATIERKRVLVPLPFALAKLQASVLQYLPKPPLTPDQVELLRADNVVSEQAIAERRTLDEVEPRDVVMSMSVDGEQVSTGNGAACLGDPIDAVVWLARQARELGDPLRAGQVVLSGALGPMRPVAPGSHVTATISGLGSVSVSFPRDGRSFRT